MLCSRFTSLSRALSTSASRLSHLEVVDGGNHVFHVKLNRPTKRNTFTFETWKEMKRVFDDLSLLPACRSIVLSGEGKSFCAGIDLQEGITELIGLLQDEKVDAARKGRAISTILKGCQDGFTAIETCVKPVIAVVHSHCIGAGIDLITACDVRYATKDAVFSIKEVDVGLAADVGTLARIQKVVGNDSITRELAFTARNFGAAEAQQIGLLSRVFDDQSSALEEAMKTAALIAEKSPIAVQGTKVNLNYGRDHSVADSLDYIRLWNMSQLNSEDLVKAGMAVMTKSKADFDNV